MPKHRVVLVGERGTGRTTFFNKITGSQQNTRNCEELCTCQIIQGNSLCQFNNGFQIIDTPAMSKKLEHIAGIQAALTHRRVDRILIIVKFGRDNEIQDQLDRVLKLVRKFKQLITIIITHWDLSKNKENDSKRIQELMYQKQITSTLFFSRFDGYYDICQTIGSILLNSQNDQCVELLESEIYEFLEIDPFEKYQLKEHDNSILRDFRKLSNNYQKFIINLDDKLPHFLDILHQVIIKIREDANYYVEQFIRKHADEIEELVDTSGRQIHYLHYMSMKKQIWADIQTVEKLAYQRMNKQERHFFFHLRQCPYCGEVWLNVSQCYNNFMCGKRNFSITQKEISLGLASENTIQIINDGKNEISYQIKEQQNFNIQFTRSILSYLDQEYSWQKKELIEKILIREYGKNFEMIQDSFSGKLTQTNLTKDNIIQKIKNSTEFSKFLNEQNKIQNIQGIGCGKWSIWCELPPFFNIEELLAPELSGYFADQVELRRDETEFLNREYKKLINEEIQFQQKNIKIIYQNKKNQNQEQQVPE